MDEPIRIQALPAKQKHRKKSTVVMLAALGLFLVSFPLIYIIMILPVSVDLLGVVLYFCGPLPIVPAAIFLVGYVMLLCGR